MNESPYFIDDDRAGRYDTGIYVRAKHDGKYGSFDIGDLDNNSLINFLRSRGEKNEWAEGCVLHLLGHKT